MSTSTQKLFEPLTEKKFRNFWFASLLSEVGDWAGRLALAALVYAATRSALMSALTVAVSLLPALGPGQILTSWLDRFDRRKVLVSLDLARAVIFVGLAFSPPSVVVLILAAIAGLLTAPFDAIQSSMAAEVSSGKYKTGALTLISLSQNGSALLGYAIGGALLAFLSPSVALGLNAISFLLSAYLLTKVPLPYEDIKESSPWRGIHDGINVLRSARLFWQMAILSILSLAAGTVIESLVVAYYQQAGNPNLQSIALPLIGGSTLIILAALSPQSKKVPLSKVAILLGVFSFISAGFLLTGNIVLSLVAFFFAGMFFVPVSISSITVKPLYPLNKRATTVSLITGMRSALSAVLIFGAGFFSDKVGTGYTLSVLMIIVGIISMLIWVSAHRRKPELEFTQE